MIEINQDSAPMLSPAERIARDKEIARQLPGTYLFDGARAQLNYRLNKMGMSLKHAANRAAFAADEAAYCRQYGLDDATIALVQARDWLGMVKAGGNIFYIFKIASIDHVTMQHLGAQQNSLTLDAFRARLNAYRET